MNSTWNTGRSRGSSTRRETEKMKITVVGAGTWGTALGGEICIHGGGDTHDWTAGCIALSDENIRELFALCHEGDTVIISP